MRCDGGVDLPMLVWQLPVPLLAIASAPLGGGIGTRRWVLNATVVASYDNEKPAAHLAQLAGGEQLNGEGVGFLTAVDVRDRVVGIDGSVTAVATVGLGEPQWAAAPEVRQPARPGTINIVAFLPVRLADAALVNAIATVTEAKVQALVEAGVPGSGTATDATCVLCPADGSAQPYGGPRSVWGSRLARSVHAAVRAGIPLRSTG
jgi:adenosylcobinamide hydrolase